MASGPGRTMGRVEWGLLLGLSIIWGGSFLFNEVLLETWDPLTVVAGRVVLAAVALLVVIRASSHAMPPAGPAWSPYLVLGMLNNVVPYILIVWGQTRLESGLAAILNATTPLFAIVVAHLATRDERLLPRTVAGGLVGLAGVAILVGPGALTGGAAGVALAQVAILGASLSYACAGVFGRRLRGTAPLVIATGQMTASSLFMLPLALLADRPWERGLPGPGTWAALFGLAIPCTAVAYLIYFRLLARAGATNTVLVTVLIPVSATVLGVAFLGESLAGRQLAGMALIGLGLLTTDGRLGTMLRRRIGHPDHPRPAAAIPPEGRI